MILKRRSLILRSALRLNWSQFRPWLALRSTLGVALPILLGGVAGHPVWGMVAALGALMAGMASFHGVYRTRARLMVTTSVAMALAAGLGDLVAQDDLLAILGVALISLLLARHTATPHGANTVIIQAFTVQTLLLGFPRPEVGLLGTAGLVLAGGLLQTLLLVLVWPANPRRAERQAVAAAYDGLALFVTSLDSPAPTRLPGVLPLQSARTILTDAQRLGSRPEHHALVQALRRAEALHAALVGFAQADAAVRQTGVAGEQQANATLALLAKLLRTVGQQVRQGQAPHFVLEDLEGLKGLVLTMEKQLPVHNQAAHQEYAQWTGILLVHLQFLQGGAVGTALPAPPAPLAVPSPVWPTVLRGHVLRFTATMTLATAAERLLRLPNGFWIPLTVCLVLRPEFAVTVHRGVTRVAGTLVGVGTALVLMLVIHPTGALLSGLLIVASWLAYALFLTNYALFSAVITVYIILSLSVAGHAGQVLEVSAQRLLATLLGGALALGSYLLWPTWHAPHVGNALWEAVTAQQAYAHSLDRRLQGDVQAPVDERRGHARRWRLRVDDLLQAALVEPHWACALPKAAAHEVVTALNANAAALLAIEAQLEMERPDRQRALRLPLTQCLQVVGHMRSVLQPYAPAQGSS
ncbi:FUSC family protein [Deinococcus navajonensis]|uniref:FUSC family protein n=1 Tax=Deinococcus navajonensis TaxID=309884 RepID=A0ABV8XNW9_9DEIO